eukprot:1087847-Prymnesium_polylepis.1
MLKSEGMFYSDWWVTLLCEGGHGDAPYHQTFQTSRRPDVPSRAQTYPDVPRRHAHVVQAQTL